MIDLELQAFTRF